MQADGADDVDEGSRPGTLPASYGCPVSTASPAPHASRHAARASAAAALVAAVLVATATLGVLAGVAPRAAHAAPGAVPSRVLEADAEGADVELRPSALRTDTGTAEVEVVLGEDAPGDVLVELTLTEPAVTTDGTVTPGPPATTGWSTGGGRLRPGEVLRATVGEVDAPLVVVATVRAASGGGTTTTATTLAAVVLPGPLGPAPAIGLEEVDGQLRGTISADAPLLVSARLRGEQVVTHPDRLVLPGHPVVVTGAAARWPLPSELVVTDEADRSATVSTGGTALRVLAVGLVVAAATGVTVLVRRQRGTGPA